MSRAPQKNGPASPASDPSRGSTPEKDQNMQSNTTAAAHRTRPSDAAIADAMRDLETPIREMRAMANIMANMLDDKLKDVRVLLEGRRPDGHWHIHLTDHQMDLLAFAWNNVVNRADEVERAWQAAVRGEGVAE
jgi:hypothetical protein